MLLQTSKSESRAETANVWKRRAAAWSRWLHIYLSMVSFGVLFFFAVTGLTLNHTEWFDGRQTTQRHTGTLPSEWLRAPVNQLQIVEQLRHAHRIGGRVADFRSEGGQISLSAKGPGYTADVFIDRDTGSYELNETRSGFWAVLNDLHKGRDTGPAWAAVIDASALLMILVSLTGLILIFYLRKRLLTGLLTLTAGAAATCAAYFLWVP